MIQNDIRTRLAKVFPLLYKISQRIRVFVLSLKSPEEVFTDFYKNNNWKNSESVSGSGSTVEVTKKLRMQLPIVVEQFKINTFLDLPCGDYNWMKLTGLKVEKYIGGDIVEELINDNNKKYKNDSVSFAKLNLMVDRLPACDLLFTRDCLVHLSYSDIKKCFDNIKNNEVKYAMLTTFPNVKANTDIVTGRWRSLNFSLAPFNLPAPEVLIEEDERTDELKKCMGIWKVKDLNIHI